MKLSDLKKFEGWDTAHMLRLTADRLENPVNKDIMLANANYLRRMASRLTEDASTPSDTPISDIPASP